MVDSRFYGTCDGDGDDEKNGSTTFWMKTANSWFKCTPSAGNGSRCSKVIKVPLLDLMSRRLRAVVVVLSQW